MKKGAIISLLMTCCAFCFSQELAFSRVFQAFKKNVPIAIINSAEYFYVLRYNKDVHDFTIEKRAKPTAEIIGFTPLKMDQVNASWFNYENLDYLFFEHRKKLYFLFEKVVNTKKTMYLKIIDTLNHSSDFIELASLEKDKTLQDFGFTFKITEGKNILIVSSQTFFNGSTKKTALLYDVEKRQVISSRKLPIENAHTGASSAFECNAAGDLFYVLTKSHLAGFKRRYLHHAQVSVPVFFHDSVILASYLNREQPVIIRKPLLANISSLNSIHLLPGGDSVIVLAHVAIQLPDSTGPDVYFFAEKLSSDLGRQYYTVTTPLHAELKKTLTFYDGSDDKSASDKEYAPVEKFSAGDSHYQVSERRVDNFSKEVLVWQTSLASGHVTRQYLVPRKMFSMGFTRFRNEGGVMLVFSEDKLKVVVLEAGGNFKKPASEFQYNRFKKVTHLWGANVVMYTGTENGPDKKLLYRNSDFDIVPLTYHSNGQKDMVFYLSSGKFEKFAILKLSPL